ncbi:hypothetical protein A3709_18930 [Halioglobus sp. HI00S01]|uniref:RES family NAD+ phosphorylase n=1 Tax=Halioglobus sp. HI00S01 TaxID=1822214 RepID=UPI0007C2ABBB|nr:RES family NAD+ phosphorylase [Halioglobus sp. HI00S01]KZX57699.1 hypothetical protein A3709_18930 [Halioglobus sp. HI00S01]
MRSPPAQTEFDAIDLVITDVPAGTPLFRIHQTTHGPHYFGAQATNRWDCPKEVAETDRYGIMYLGTDFEAAFLEVCGRNAHRRRKTIDMELDRERAVIEWVNDTPIRALDLTEHGLARVNMDITDAAATGDILGNQYRNTQAWSQRFHDHPAKVDGIFYRCKANPSCISLALFDRWGGEFEIVDHQPLRGRAYSHEYMALVSRYRLTPEPY